jgi:acetyl-CoA C-acetyltransferase
MKSSAKQVYVLGSARIPFVKSQTNYANVTRKDLMVISLNELIKKFGSSAKVVGSLEAF